MSNLRSPAVPAPRLSILLLAYNQAATVASAACSVLAQDIDEPLEIILSDDASTDATFDILQAVANDYDGPHQVSARRNARNLGIGGHYNALVALARGTLLLTAAGDDVSLPTRARRVAAAWDATGGRADLVASRLIDLAPDGTAGRVIEVDDLSAWHGVDDWARQRPYVVGAAHAFTRRLWDRFGPIDPGVVYEDQIITLRAILGGGGITVTEPLVQYRRGGASARVAFEDRSQFLQRSRTVNDRLRAEQAQQLADARTAGCEPHVHGALATSIAREDLVHALLTQPGAAAAVAAIRRAGNLPLGWRLRKWLYLRSPAVGTGVRRLQHLSKQWRGRA